MRSLIKNQASWGNTMHLLTFQKRLCIRNVNRYFYLTLFESQILKVNITNFFWLHFYCFQSNYPNKSLILDQKQTLVFSSKIVEEYVFFLFPTFSSWKFWKTFKPSLWRWGREGHYGKLQYSPIFQWALFKNNRKKGKSDLLEITTQINLILSSNSY